MSIKNRVKMGPNYVPAYQAAGTPFVTSSVASGTNRGPVRVQFPYVTKTITVSNLDNDTALRIAFSSSGSYAVGEAVGGSSHNKPGHTDAYATAYQGNNFFLLPQVGATATPGAATITLDVRTTEVYFTADHATNTARFSCYAGLTGIERSEFPTLTASNGFYGVG